MGVFAVNRTLPVYGRYNCLHEQVSKFLLFLQRKRHRIALKKRRVVQRREQAADYARLLALRTKEAKVKRAEEVKRRRSRSASKSSVGTQ